MASTESRVIMSTDSYTLAHELFSHDVQGLRAELRLSTCCCYHMGPIGCLFSVSHLMVMF